MKGTNRKNTENTNRKNIKKTRVAQLKKRLLISGLIITVMLFAILTLDNFVNVSATNDKENLYKYYTSYEIQPGDTLTSIAQKYTVNSDVSVSEYIDELKKDNRLATDKITSGKYLVVSYYSNEYK